MRRSNKSTTTNEEARRGVTPGLKFTEPKGYQRSVMKIYTKRNHNKREWHNERDQSGSTPPAPSTGTGTEAAARTSVVGRGRAVVPAVEPSSARHLRLNDRERDFLENMLQWPGLPTPRQAAWVEQIERRITATLNDQPQNDGAA